MTKIDVYVEVGKKLTHAIAPEWPGWSRSGPDEASALQTLVDFGPRYARVLHSQGLPFEPPSGAGDLVVRARMEGNATTDFGVPHLGLPGDELPVDPAELDRFVAILRGCWTAFDATVLAATGHTLRKGPRGGGRSLPQVIQHVHDVELAYLRSLGARPEAGEMEDAGALREFIVHSMRASAAGEIPSRGPRGGVRWTVRYFVRRLAWHELYHTRVTEDRIE